METTHNPANQSRPARPVGQGSVNQSHFDPRVLAEQSVLQKGNEWVIQFKTPVEGVDLDATTTYKTRELAIDAAFNALKLAQSQAA